MTYIEVKKTDIKKWADLLYSISKNYQKYKLDKNFSDDIYDLSKRMYKQIDQTLSDNVNINISEIDDWFNKLQYVSKEIESDLLINNITDIKMKIDMLLTETIMLDKPYKNIMPPHISRSILLSYTLWYGGQNFSITNKEIADDLGLDYNNLNETLSSLLSNKIFERRNTGLIVINPKYQIQVDSSLLLLLSYAINLSLQYNKKRKFNSLQEGFLNFNKNRYNNMVDLFDNNRSYISDYCQRIFGNLYDILNLEDIKPDYQVLKRFLIRLSLYPFEKFIISNDSKMEKLFNLLKKKKIISVTPIYTDENIILIDKKMI